MKAELMKIAKEFLLAMKEDLDPWTTQKSELTEETANSITLLTPFHIQFAKYGRAPGKQPPLDPILEWVQRKGLGSGEREQTQIAWAIVKSIAKNGTLNWVPDAPYFMEETINKHAEAFYARVAEFYKVTLKDYGKHFEYYPKEILEFKI